MKSRPAGTAAIMPQLPSCRSTVSARVFSRSANRSTIEGLPCHQKRISAEIHQLNFNQSFQEFGEAFLISINEMGDFPF